MQIFLILELVAIFLLALLEKPVIIMIISGITLYVYLIIEITKEDL